MADIFSRTQRSRIMARVRSRDTAPEKLVRSILHSMGHRFRLNVATLPGKPDIVLKRHRKIVFVHGCFWHGHHGCKRAARPTTSTRFWNQKIDSNIRRDRKTRSELKKQNWKVLVVWQCQTRRLTNLKNMLTRFMVSN